MAGYNEIRGLRVKYLSADPANPEDGQVWYNSTTGNLRVQSIGSGAWSSSSNALVARDTAASTGPQTSALVFGGATPSRTTATEEYNGSGWSTGGVLPTATTGMGSARNASQTAALGMGGYDGAKTGATFQYDGTSWTAAGTMGTPRQLYMVGGGTQTAAITFGGDTYPPAPSRNTTATEEYDGSSWTAANSLGTGGYSGAGTGPQSAAVRMGAPSTSNNTVTENFDGTNWTASGTIPISKSAMLAAGTQTASILFGGIPAPLSTTALEYDGSTYSAISSPAIIKYNNAGGGSSSAAFMSHGRTPAPAFVTTTEEYNFSSTTVTPAAWASAPSIGTGRYLGGYGITPTNASIIFGGQSATGSVANTEEYNGSSWAENPDMNTARSRINGFGTQTAAVTMGGRQVGVPPNSVMNNTELYDGSSWTNGPAYPLTARGIGGAGTNTAGLAIGAYPGPPVGVATCNDWNGSGWTAAEANLNTARGYASGWGTQGDAGAAGGPPANTDYEEYNGSSWTTKASLVTATGGPSGGAAGFGGTPGAIKANGNGGTFSQEWNGTSWGTAVSRANTNYGGGMSGGNTAASGIVTGGYIYPLTGPATGSEEFTGETITANSASNLSVS